MDPQVEALKIKVGSMIQCVNNVREAQIQLGISNSVQIPELRLSVDVRNAEHRLGEARLLLAARYTDLVNYVLSTFQISSFTFLMPESDAEVDAMEKCAKCLLGLCDDPAVLAVVPNGVVASAPNGGAAAAPNGVGAPAPNGVVSSAGPNSVVIAVPNGVAPPAVNEGSNGVVEAGEEDKRSFRGWLKGRGDKFTGVLDNTLIVLTVLCGVAWTLGRSIGVLCVVLGAMTGKLKQI